MERSLGPVVGEDGLPFRMAQVERQRLRDQPGLLVISPACGTDSTHFKLSFS
jgi:hypothetical protein